MAIRDLASVVNPKVAFKIQTISTDTTTVGETIDMFGYESVVFSIQSAAVTTGVLTPAIYESDDSGMSGEAVVTADYLIGTIALATFGTSDDDAVKKIGYVGKKRYVRLKLVSSSSAAAVVGAQAIQGDAHRNPIPWNG